MVRDAVQAAYFATGTAADAFNVATRIPQLLRDLFAEGAMSAAFVPTFTKTLATEGRDAAWKLGSQVINALVLVTGVLVVLGIVFAGPLVMLYAEDYQNIAGKLPLTIELARVNMPFLLLIAVASACMGMLNAHKRFVAPAVAPALYNVVFILCTIVFVPIFVATGVEPVMALSAGMLLGGVAQIVMQWPDLKREGYRHSWSIDFRNPHLREMLILMGPATLGVAAAQINLLVNTSLATGAEEGAVTALNFAFRLMYMPVGIIGVAVATAAIPDLARHAAAQNLGDMRGTLSWGMRLMLMLSVPATVGLMVLASPIIQLVFERGQFGAHSTTLVAGALFYYAPGIVSYSLVKILSPSFYSLRDSRTPMLISLVTIAVNLVLNLWLIDQMGFKGLALGTSIAATVNAGLLLVFLSRRIDGIDGTRIGTALLKITVASVVMGAAAWAAERGLNALLPETLLGTVEVERAVRVLGAVGAGMAVLALASWALRIEEFRQVIARILTRVNRRRASLPQ